MFNLKEFEKICILFVHLYDLWGVVVTFSWYLTLGNTFIEACKESLYSLIILSISIDIWQIFNKNCNFWINGKNSNQLLEITFLWFLCYITYMYGIQNVFFKKLVCSATFFWKFSFGGINIQLFEKIYISLSNGTFEFYQLIKVLSSTFAWSML